MPAEVEILVAELAFIREEDDDQTGVLRPGACSRHREQSAIARGPRLVSPGLLEAIVASHVGGGQGATFRRRGLEAVRRLRHPLFERLDEGRGKACCGCELEMPAAWHQNGGERAPERLVRGQGQRLEGL